MRFKRIIHMLCWILSISLLTVQAPLWGQQTLKSKFASQLSEDDKESILSVVRNIKEKLESDNSGYTLETFMAEAETVFNPSLDLTIHGMISINVIENRMENPEKISVHVPEVVIKNDDDIPETYLSLTLDFKRIRICENWKLLMQKSGDTWKIRKKILFQMGTPLFKPFIKTSDIYAFRDFSLQHDRFSITFDEGFLAPVFAGKNIYAMAVTGKGKVEFTPPDPVETYQLEKFTEKSALNISTEEVFLTFTPEEFEIFFAGIKKEKTSNPAAYETLVTIMEGRQDFHDIKDNYIYTPDKPGTLQVEFNTRSHGWLCYEQNPDLIKEIRLFKEKKYKISTFRDEEVWCEYHSANDRNTKSEIQMELENKTDLDILKLTSDVTIEKDGALNVTATVSYAAMYNDLDYTTFMLDPGLKLKSIVDYRDRSLLFYQDHYSVRVYFPESPPLRKIRSFTIKYSGKNFTDQMTQGTYYVKLYWFPIWRFFDQHYCDFTIRVPKPFIALSNGYPKREWEEDKYNASEWTSSRQIAFPVIMYGRYVLKKDMADSIPVYLYATTDTLTHMQPILVQAREAIRFYNRLLGKYPYEQISLVESRFHGFGAQAPTTIIYVGSTNFMSMAERASYMITTIMGRGTVSHEVSHQWWGSMVRPINDHEYWWVESLAQFSEALFLQAAEGDDSFQKELFQWKSLGLDADKAGPVQMGYRFGSADGQSLIYYKGPYVFHMLRMMFGSEKMAKYLKNIVTAFQNEGAISTRILEMIAEKTFAVKLDWFFDQWVRRNGIPTYYWNYDVSPKDDKWEVKVNVDQKVFAGKNELKGVFFKMPVPLRMYFGGEEKIQRNLTINTDTHTFTFIVDKKPKKITLNEYEAVFAKVEKK